MCVDLICNADPSGRSDKMAKDIKSMIMLDLDEQVKPKSDWEAGEYERLLSSPYAVMWPMIKVPGSGIAKVF